MRPETVRVAELHAQTPLYRNRLTKARAVIREAFEKNPAWYVATSGGKDSSVVLSLVREQYPDVAAVTSLHEWCLPETADYLAQIPCLDLTASGSDHGTGWAPNWEGPQDLPPGVTWLGAKIGEKDRTLKNYGRSETGVFLGLRADESAGRRVHLRTLGPLFFSQKNRVWQSSPLAWWSVREVWAYLLTNKITYNRAYDVMDALGIPLEHQRIGPLAVEKVLGYGPLAILKRGWPLLFNTYAAKHPEARAYV